MKYAGSNQVNVAILHITAFCGILAYCLATNTVMSGWAAIGYLISGILAGFEGIDGVIREAQEL